MKVSEAVGRTLTLLGIRQVFGVIGSGNFHVTNAMVASGATFTQARHENGAVTMADAFSRMSGQVSAASLHQGCGLTNGLTGLTEAAKSRTPLIVVTGDTPPTNKTSNFWIDQTAAVGALGVEVERIYSAETAIQDTVRAYGVAKNQHRTVLLNLPLDVQEIEMDWYPELVHAAIAPLRSAPSPAAVRDLATLLQGAQRPILIGGRGARHASAEIELLAEKSGALLATSAVVRGLFEGNTWNIDAMGGFSSPETAALIRGADVIVAFGASLNQWTTQNGVLVADAVIVQVDIDAMAIGRHRNVDLGIIADSAEVASAVSAELVRLGPNGAGYRTEELECRLLAGIGWHSVPFEEVSTSQTMDPRTLTIGLNNLLPVNRQVVMDAGNFCGYPAMFLDVPAANRFCMPLAFQSIGLGLAASIGASLANPDVCTVAGIGDGGFMMSLVELDTAVRLRMPLVVIVYNDNAYGAEVHHFAPDGVPLDIVEFPDTDIAAIARGFGCDALTVRSTADLQGVVGWLNSSPRQPLVIDAKISSLPSWLLQHSFTAETLK